ncbi:MAG: hypothetical protein CMO16_04310 [Thaumarchaeota archaeon]|nr:hypothetical protein [Nitrososphaerota archaeon]|tara:strand:- start:295 stop:687 length:393 start_codon:yes stop_codon:yes gene_type:complete
MIISETGKSSDGVFSFTGKRVSVKTSEQRIYKVILPYNDKNLSVVIENTDVGINKSISNRNAENEVKLKSFNTQTFVKILNYIFPDMMMIAENTIIVTDNNSMTENRVQGSELAADHVKVKCDQFIRENK